jgi:hypothetical protein
MTTFALALLTLATVPAPTGEQVAELRAPDWAAEFAPSPKRDAGPDAPSAEDIRRAAAALVAELAVDEVLATRAGQRLINSAILCQSVELLTAEGQSAAVARRQLAAAGVAATDRLERARIEPLACDAYPVERLVQCLGILPAAACTEDDELAAQLAAAERLASVTP